MISSFVGLKREPTFVSTWISRLDETISESQSFMLSGIRPFDFSPAFPPAAPSGLLISAKITETAATTAVVTPTAKAAFVGCGTQTCCRRVVVDDGGGTFDSTVVLYCAVPPGVMITIWMESPGLMLN